MDETVTINKAHFEALLRRAEFYSANNQYYESCHPQNVSIAKAEYDSLCQSATEYETLRNALLGGGIAPETLDVLVGKPSEPEQPRKDSGCDTTVHTQYPHQAQEQFYLQQPYLCSSSRPASGDPQEYIPGYQQRHNSQDHLQVPGQDLTWQQQRDFGDRPYTPISFDDSGEEATGTDYDQTQDAANAPFARKEQRTLLITGLSDRITYKDLTNVIRGGRILYITIRGDRTAAVFMLEGAAEFLAHVKRHDLYVQTKRLEVKWNDYQFHLAPYVGRKIAAGASRNLIIRNAAQAVKVSEIRHHMEHIHKFDIIDVEVRGRDVLIYTNSVHNALFARTCMLSRKPYKGFKIGFFPDECAGPLPAIQHRYTNKRSSVPAKKRTTGNLFEMLSLESDEENLPSGRQDDDESTLDGDADTVDLGQSKYGIKLT